MQLRNYLQATAPQTQLGKYTHQQMGLKNTGKKNTLKLFQWRYSPNQA
jgi:hypothetical protein